MLFIQACVQDSSHIYMFKIKELNVENYFPLNLKRKSLKLTIPDHAFSNPSVPSTGANLVRDTFILFAGESSQNAPACSAYNKTSHLAQNTHIEVTVNDYCKNQQKKPSILQT